MEWYVRRDESVSGPFGEQEVVKRIADGNIPRRALVRQSPDEEWCPIESSVFLSAFGPSNPYANPKLMARESAASQEPTAGQAGAGVWFAVAVACVVNLVVSVQAAAASGEGSAHEVGYVFGAFMGRAVGALVWVGIFQIWKSNRTQERRLIVFVAVHALEFAVRLGLRFFVR